MWFAAVASAVAAWSLWTDWRAREVPNWLTGALAAMWVAAWATMPEALGTAPAAGLVCGAGGLVLGFAFHAAGWLGAGDGKLLAALALWLGPRDLPFALLGTSVLGLLLLVLAWARPEGEFRTRGIPFAWALAPPAATLLLARAVAG